MNSEKQAEWTSAGIWRALRVSLAGLLLVAAAFAEDRPVNRDTGSSGGQGSGSGSGSGAGNGPFLAGDETIGSLPILAPTLPFNVLELYFDHNACIYLEGNRMDVLSSVVSCVGRTAATLRVLDEDSDTVRVVFHGRPLLQLDRDLVDSGAVHIGLMVPSAFGLGTLATSFGGRVLPEQGLMRGASVIAPALIDAIERLQGHLLRLTADGEKGAHTELALRSTRRFLFIGQTH